MKFQDLFSDMARAALNGIRKRSSIPLAVVAGEIGLGVYADEKNNVTHLTSFLSVDGQGGLMQASAICANGEWDYIESTIPQGGRKILHRINVSCDPTRPLAHGERLTTLRVRFTPSGRVLYSLETPSGAQFIPQSPNFLLDRTQPVFRAIERLILNIGGKMTPDAGLVPYAEASMPAPGYHPNVGPEVLDREVEEARDRVDRALARRVEAPLTSAPLDAAMELAGALDDEF